MENKILSAYENRPRTLWSRLALGAVLVALMAWSATAAVDYTLSLIHISEPTRH